MCTGGDRDSHAPSDSMGEATPLRHRIHLFPMPVFTLFLNCGRGQLAYPLFSLAQGPAPVVTTVHGWNLSADFLTP